MPTVKTLLSLLADGNFHSGEALGRVLGVSRAAVWKSLKVMAQQYGISVNAVQGRGYRLPAPLELLDLSSIEDAISPAARAYVGPIELLFEVDSTNRRLLTQAGAAPQATVCLAEMQTAGKGRRGRVWVSPLGANIYFSLLWHFSEGPAKLGGLSLGVAVAVLRALRRFGVAGVQVKWPNDLLWEQKKIAGILLEVTGESNGPCQVVVGIGINIGMPSECGIDQPWADLLDMVPNASRNRVAGTLIEEVVGIMRQFEQSGFEAVREEWLRCDAFAGKPVTLYLPNGAVSGIARGVDTGGHLLLETQGGIQRYASGEVSLRGE
jgi:BirA family biotin operon repressor/biotin-[acetyl-CoA-carboxylase] ligase